MGYRHRPIAGASGTPMMYLTIGLVDLKNPAYQAKAHNGLVQSRWLAKWREERAAGEETGPGVGAEGGDDGVWRVGSDGTSLSGWGVSGASYAGGAGSGVPSG